MTKNAIVLALALAGCGATDALSEACGGTRPALDACTNGLAHSECGGDGDGDDVLACNEIGGECRWFVGGCVAVGFRPIDCPSNDVCCLATAEGPWPFEASWSPTESWARRELVEDVAFIGGDGPISGTTPATVEVTVDPLLEPPEPRVECEGIELGLCDNSPIPGRAIRTHDSTVLVFAPQLYGDELYLEVVEQEDESLVGRAFTRYVYDVAEEAPLSCDAARTRHLPFSGTLLIDRLAEYPIEAHGVLELAHASGGTVRIAF